MEIKKELLSEIKTKITDFQFEYSGKLSLKVIYFATSAQRVFFLEVRV